MSSPLTRRDFVGGTLAAGAIAGLGDFAFLGGLPAVSADEVKNVSKVVRLADDLEPLVRLLEDTPREKVLETVADKVRSGVGYQQWLATVLLAGVRGVRPRPVGFKFHAVLVINSAHLASLAAGENDRWLPLFWAIDNYKSSQAQNQKEGGWMMPPVDEAKLPDSSAAKQRFIEAMDNWDEEGADRAVAALARCAGAGEIIELFWRYGSRDFRDIGHKAIYVANAWRTLQTIGWRHAEPVLRSLAFALLEHEGDNPAKRDADQDRPGRENVKKAAKIRATWQTGKISPEAATEMLATLRTGGPRDGADKVVELLNKEISPDSVWDGLFLGAGELLMRQPGIVGLHAVTTTNALHQAYVLSGNDETRRVVTLQAASFLPMFLKAMTGRGKVGDGKLDALEKAEVKGEPTQAIEEIFAELTKDKTKAAQKALALVSADPMHGQPLIAAAQRLIFTKGRDSHDYKFSSAALEDFHHVGSKWRPYFLASSLYWLKGSGDPDNGLVKRTRAALAKG